MAGSRPRPPFLSSALQLPTARRRLLAAAVLTPAAAAAVVAQGAVAAAILARVATAAPPLSQLSAELWLLGGLIGARLLLFLAVEALAASAGVRAAEGLRLRLADALLVDPLAPALSGAGGAVVSLATDGAEGVAALVGGYLPQVLFATAVPLFVLAYVLYLDPIAGSLLGVTVPLLLLFLALVGRHAAEAARERQAALGRLSSYFLDLLSGLGTGRAFRRERVQREALRRSGEVYRQKTLETLRAAFLSALVLELAAMVGMALVAVVVGVQLDGGETNLRVGLTALLLGPELFGAIRSLGQRYHQGSEGKAALALSSELERSLERSRGGTPRPVQIASQGVCLRLSKVAFSYPDRTEKVLAGVELRLEEGEVAVIVGKSGCGKSTLGYIAAGLLAPTGGTVGWGAPLLATAAQSRAPVALLPQRPITYNATLLDNLRIYNPTLPPRQAEQLLVGVGLGAQLAELSLYGSVGEGGRRLSAGEGQRLAIARLLASEAPLWIVDEPFAHLEEELALELLERLLSAVGTRTLVVLAHEGPHPSAAKLLEQADAFYRLAAGRLRAVSRPRRHQRLGVVP